MPTSSALLARAPARAHGSASRADVAPSSPRRAPSPPVAASSAHLKAAVRDPLPPLHVTSAYAHMSRCHCSIASCWPRVRRLPVVHHRPHDQVRVPDRHLVRHHARCTIAVAPSCPLSLLNALVATPARPSRRATIWGRAPVATAPKKRLDRLAHRVDRVRAARRQPLDVEADAVVVAQCLLKNATSDATNTSIFGTRCRRRRR